MSLGIDISNVNGTVDLAALKKAHPSLSVLGVKRSEGHSFVDVDFPANFGRAAALGLVVTPYHFARPESDAGSDGGRREADFFCSLLAGFTKNPACGRPVLDYETVKDIAYAEAFCARVRQALGVWPMIYCSGSRVAEIDSSPILRDLHLWVAAYGAGYRQYIGTHKGTVAMWQYTDKLDGRFDASQVFVPAKALTLEAGRSKVYLYEVTAGGKLRESARDVGSKLPSMLSSKALASTVRRFGRVLISRRRVPK